MTMKMRKILTIVTVIAVFFTFASCGKSTAQGSAQQSAAAAASAGTGNGGTENGAQGTQTAQTAAPAQNSLAAQAAIPAQNSQTAQQSQAAQTASQSQTAQTAQTVQGGMSARSSQISQAAQSAQTSDAVTVTGGNYSVDILSAWIDKDYTGNQVIVVKFNFTNKGSNSACFGDATRVTVKQNGSTLNGDGIIMDSSSFGGYSFNFRTPVSNGASVTCVYAYPYSSAADLDVSVRLVTNDNACTTLGSGSATVSIG